MDLEDGEGLLQNLKGEENLAASNWKISGSPFKEKGEVRGEKANNELLSGRTQQTRETSR